MQNGFESILQNPLLRNCQIRSKQTPRGYGDQIKNIHRHSWHGIQAKGEEGERLCTQNNKAQGLC
ncbi:hypothetical protein RHMOL_Rhmol09G0091800 [Rhododendron molle]|uniref:Uncharacterized protein n=1 Tax=Rhododendron molle TaxID=49168 RepID=A0ACC0MCS3_RHOML|nr:hypothetical protein RHMOL_Rhmol09G0091800 [Rhododendron molle]